MPTAAVQNVRLVIAAANVRGVPPGKLIAAAGLDPQALLDADGRIPLEPALRAWQIASELSGDPAFGLSAVEHLRPDAFGLLGFAVHASACVGEGLRRLARYFHVVNQNVSLELAESGGLARVRVLADHEGATVEELRHPIECLVAALLLIARRATGRAVAPAAVSFRHAAPADLAPYLRAFGAAPRFAQP